MMLRNCLRRTWGNVIAVLDAAVSTSGNKVAETGKVGYLGVRL